MMVVTRSSCSTLFLGQSMIGSVLALVRDTEFGPHAVRPRTARTIQINKHAPMNPAIR